MEGKETLTPPLDLGGKLFKSHFKALNLAMMNEKFDLAAFKEQLEAHTDFPTLYMFKFIVPLGKEKEVANLLPNNEMVLKKSKKGNYVSATIKAMMPSSAAIVAIYKKASEIEGIISL